MMLNNKINDLGGKIPHLHKYIGIPYSTAHCWQLVALVQREVFGVVVPMLDAVNPANPKAVATAIREQQNLDCWQRCLIPKHGAIVLMHRAKLPSHAGVYIKTKTVCGVIHTSQQSGSVFTPINRIADEWNITGYYIYTSGCNAPAISRNKGVQSHKQIKGGFND